MNTGQISFDKVHLAFPRQNLTEVDTSLAVAILLENEKKFEYCL